MCEYVTLNEASELVNELNRDIYDLNEDEETLYVHLEFYQDEIYINFLDQTVWSSIDDEREYDEDADEYEPLGPWLRKRINSAVETIVKIKL